MILSKQERRYKTYLKLESRYSELRKKLRDRTLVKLKEPFQKGWELYLDLRSDIKNREDYPSIKVAFDMVQHIVTTRNKSLVLRIRANRRYDKIVHENALGDFRYKWGNLPSISMIRQEVWEKLAPDIKRWFSLDSYRERWSSFRGHWYYLDIPKYWIEMKVRPNIMTHQYLTDGGAQGEYEKLKNKLAAYWLEFGVNYSSSYPAYKDRVKVRDKIQKFRKGEIEDITNEKIPKEYDY